MECWPDQSFWVKKSGKVFCQAQESFEMTQDSRSKFRQSRALERDQRQSPVRLLQLFKTRSTVTRRVVIARCKGTRADAGQDRLGALGYRSPAITRWRPGDGRDIELAVAHRHASDASRSLRQTLRPPVSVVHFATEWVRSLGRLAPAPPASRPFASRSRTSAATG